MICPMKFCLIKNEKPTRQLIEDTCQCELSSCAWWDRDSEMCVTSRVAENLEDLARIIDDGTRKR